MDDVERKVDSLAVEVAKIGTKVELLDEVRADVKGLRDDVTGIKAKAGLVAAAAASLVTLIGHFLGAVGK